MDTCSSQTHTGEIVSKLIFTTTWELSCCSFDAGLLYLVIFRKIFGCTAHFTLWDFDMLADLLRFLGKLVFNIGVLRTVGRYAVPYIVEY